MAKAKRQERHDFTVTVNGKEYQCYRIVTGTRVLYQEIHVLGCGSEKDLANYGPNDHPVVSMRGIAELIATRVIEKSSI